MTVTNATPVSATQTFTLNIAAAAATTTTTTTATVTPTVASTAYTQATTSLSPAKAPIAVTPVAVWPNSDQLPNATVGRFYQIQLPVTANGTYSSDSTNKIPAGLTLSANGLISGIPTTASSGQSVTVYLAVTGKSTQTFYLKAPILAGGEIAVGDGLLPGEYISTSNGDKFCLKSDGNLAFTRTYMFTDDANTSGTGGTAGAATTGAYLRVNNNCSIDIYNSANNQIWSSGTSKATFDQIAPCKGGKLAFNNNYYPAYLEFTDGTTNNTVVWTQKTWGALIKK